MMIAVSWYRKDESDWLSISVENQAGDEVSLLMGADKAFGENGQALINSVFGYALAEGIRESSSYKRCEYEHSQGQREVF